MECTWWPSWWWESKSCDRSMAKRLPKPRGLGSALRVRLSPNPFSAPPPCLVFLSTHDLTTVYPNDDDLGPHNT